ncbi:hypothetical protein KKC44_06435, partial [Patescibacteria group bacterium]|nr:hypothetical protein [Patescibacteria group bacterium]
MHHSDTPFPVYCPDCWWGSSWDAVKYEKDVDFEKPFFEQWAQLRSVVPALGMVISNGKNSDFSNY